MCKRPTTAVTIKTVYENSFYKKKKNVNGRNTRVIHLFILMSLLTNDTACFSSGRVKMDSSYYIITLYSDLIYSSRVTVILSSIAVISSLRLLTASITHRLRINNYRRWISFDSWFDRVQRVLSVTPLITSRPLLVCFQRAVVFPLLFALFVNCADPSILQTQYLFLIFADDVNILPNIRLWMSATTPKRHLAFRIFVIFTSKVLSCDFPSS